ncbi:MAG: hypothetical protein CMJ18_05275 [Phycisphaeraceae bacterium]|nr:hypothetical protein [Phycisphaeraceae bacterium]
MTTHAPSRHSEIGKILIVGANGNIGRHLIPALLALGYEVRALQYRSKVEPRPGLETAQGNTLDQASLDQALDGVDAVCHLIRATGPGDSARERWFNCCVRGASNLLEAAKGKPLKRYIAGSADNVFGHVTMRHAGPINENHPKRFADEYYGLFKIVEEELCRQYWLGWEVPVVITRFPWTWVPAQARTAAGALDRESRKIRQKLDIDGKPLVRHDAVVNDIVQGILLALERDVAVGHDFNFAGPAPYSSDQLCRVLQERFDWPVEPEPTDWHSWTLDDSKARSMLGYRPRLNVLDWIAGELDGTPGE